MQYRLRTLLLVPSLVCFAAAYRFASHGIPAHDNFCIGLTVAALASGAFLVCGAFWKRKST
jgi:hypothetical protein